MTILQLDSPALDLQAAAGDALQQGVQWTRRQALLLLTSAAGAGALAVVRAGDHSGPSISRGRGVWTATGTIAVVGAHRDVRTAPPGHEAADGLGHPAGTALWSDVVTADVELHNGLDRAILVSPGQLRLRLADSTVTPVSAGFRAGPLAAGGTLASWISYLAPSDARRMSLQYVEPGARAPMVLALPGLHAHGGAR